MFTADDLSIPVFSYVGRLKDSRKGLELFFDALSIVWESWPQKSLKAWVIGGDDNDKAWGTEVAKHHPGLKERLSCGDLIFWGRIDNSALPEFYSRSTALIVPSFREQFCITALEAMMCGCPVIAARVGGLKDVVVDGRTGNLFDRGMPTSLAGVMTSYLRTPSLPRWLGANAAVWAHNFFDAESIYSTLTGLLDKPDTVECSKWLAESEIAFRKIMIDQAIPTVESLLLSDLESFHDLTSSQSISFMAQLKGGKKVFVKVYSDRPTYLNCLHEVPFPGDSLRLPRERLQSAIQLHGQSYFPSVLAHDMDAGLLIQEWIEPAAPLTFNEMRQALLTGSQLVNLYDPAPQTLSVRKITQRKLAERAQVSLDLLIEIDTLSAELHAPIVGGSLRTRRLHPQLELFRINRSFELNASWLPRDYTTRAQACLGFLLGIRPIVPALPTFAHGSLKPEHILTPQPLLCDFDHSGYFCGPVDTAHWVWNSFFHTYGNHPGPMLRQLKEELVDPSDLYLGACWILAFQLNRDLVYLSRGDSSWARDTMLFLYEFAEAFRKIDPIH